MKTTVSNKIGRLFIVGLMPLALAPTLAGATGLTNQRMGMNYNMRGGSDFGIWNNPQAMKDLDIKPEQAKKLKEAGVAAREKFLPLYTELDILQLKLDQAFATKPIVEKTVYEFTDKISAIKVKLALQMTEERLVMHKILTSEQIAKMEMRHSAATNRGQAFGMYGHGMGYGNSGTPCPMNNYEKGRGMMDNGQDQK